MRLVTFVRSIDKWRLDAVSRITIDPRTGDISASINRIQSSAPLGVHGPDEPMRPIPTGPISADNKRAVADRNPPVTLMSRLREPDITGRILTGGITMQIEELRNSGLLGGLNVGRTASGNIMIVAHGATQEERNAWVKRLMEGEDMQASDGL